MVSSAIIVFLQGVMMIPLDSPWLTTTLIESYSLLLGKSVEMNHQGMLVVSNGWMDGRVLCIRFFVN